MPGLPTELWSRIFTISVKDDLRTLPTLLAVNHTFQSIANQTPQLWSRLVFEFKDGEIDIPYARARLRRSGILPLDIRIHGLETVHPTRLAKLLRKRVGRIRTLEVNVPSYEIAEKILAIMGRRKPAPLLERLHIFYNDATLFDSFGFETPELSLQGIFRPAPRLINISLPADPLPSFESLPLFSMVKTITLDTDISVLEFSLHDVVTFLSNIPLLESFTFKGVDDEWESANLHNESVPRLLSVDVTVPGYGLEMLRHLEAPLLTRMRLDGRRSFQLDWNHSMATVLARALTELSAESPLITRLELVSIKLPESRIDYQWILSGGAFPSLQSLRLEATDITDDALRHCIRLSNNLKRLELWACQGVTGSGLLQFVQGCGEDFELLLDSCPNVTPEDIATLSNVVKVESASNAFPECINDTPFHYFPWAFTSSVRSCDLCFTRITLLSARPSSSMSYRFAQDRQHRNATRSPNLFLRSSIIAGDTLLLYP